MPAAPCCFRRRRSRHARMRVCIWPSVYCRIKHLCLLVTVFCFVMFGTRYGLHPDTFSVRRAALLKFRRHALGTLELLPDLAVTRNPPSSSRTEDKATIRVLIVQRQNQRRFSNLAELAHAIQDDAHADFCFVVEVFVCETAR